MASLDSVEKVPPFKWAEDYALIYLSIQVSRVDDPQYKFTENSLTFSGKSSGQAYALHLDFKKNIKPETAKLAQHRVVEFVIEKAEPGPFWGHLLADKKAHKGRIGVDWEKWSDESDDEDGAGLQSKLDMDQFSDYMPDDDEEDDDEKDEDDDDEDDDDEDIPDLEAPTKEAVAEDTPDLEAPTKEATKEAVVGADS